MANATMTAIGASDDSSAPRNTFQETYATVASILENARDALTNLNNQGYDLSTTMPLDLIIRRGEHLTWATPETVSLAAMNQYIDDAKSAAAQVEAKLNIK